MSDTEAATEGKTSQMTIETRAAQNVARFEARNPPAPAISTPMEILERAVSQGASVEVLEKLLALQERWEKNIARNAFDAAIADAKANMPVVAKNKHVGFQSKSAGKADTSYWHEDMAEIARTVGPALAANGLSYRYRTESTPGQPITVTCILSHRDGHFEENSLTAVRDDSGNKNSIQAIGSTVTYLQRYTLKAALGLAAGKDDDGKTADEPETLSPEQVDKVQAEIVRTKSDKAKFLAFISERIKREITSIVEIPVGKFDEAMECLAAAEKIRQSKELK